MKPAGRARRCLTLLQVVKSNNYQMPESVYWLGLDIGTGGSRALLVDEKGKVRHSFSAPHEEMSMQQPLWAEQRPENWWEAAQIAIRSLLEQAGTAGASVKGVGLPG